MENQMTIFKDIIEVGDFLKENFSNRNLKNDDDSNYEYEIIGANSIRVFIREKNKKHFFVVEYKEDKSMCLNYYKDESFEFIKDSIIPVLSVAMAKTPFATYKYKKTKNDKVINGCAVEWTDNEDERLKNLHKHKSNKGNAFPVNPESKIEIISISNHRDLTKKDDFSSIKFPITTEQDKLNEQNYLKHTITFLLSTPAINFLMDTFTLNNKHKLSDLPNNQNLNNLYNLLQSENKSRETASPSISSILSTDLNKDPVFGIPHEESFFKDIQLPKRVTENTARGTEAEVVVNPNETTIETEVVVNPNEIAMGTEAVENLDKTVMTTKNNEQDAIDKKNPTALTPQDLGQNIKNAEKNEKFEEKFEKIITYELKDSQLSDYFSLKNTKRIVGYSQKAIEPYVRDEVDKRSKFLFYKINGIKENDEMNSEVGNSLYCFNYNASNSDEMNEKWIGKVSKIELNEKTKKIKVYFDDNLQFTPLERQLSTDNVDDLNILMMGMEAQRTEKKVPLKDIKELSDNKDMVNPGMIVAQSEEVDDKATKPTEVINVEDENPNSTFNPLLNVENSTALKVLESTERLIRLWKENGESIPQELIETYQNACNVILNQKTTVENDRGISNISAKEGAQIINITGGQNTFNITSHDPNNTQKKTTKQQLEV